MTLFALLALTDAHAFCGTYVGQAGAQLYNNASQVVVARQGTRTTLTLANDYEGDATGFALLVPVPKVLAPEDVAVVDPGVFTRLDAYSAPRLVSYTCDDLHPDWDYAAPASEEDGAGAEAEGSVTVEASFTAGEYDIVVVSAQDSTELVGWLDDNGYGANDAAIDLLGEYIDGGAYFFAAKVSLDRVPATQTYLSPLRFGYDSDIFALPIRLGTLNSQGTQDLVLYAVNNYADGAVGVGNYPEAALEAECLWRADEWGSFGEFYGAQFAAAMETEDRPAWVREYAWGSAGCDPCSGEPPTGEDLAEVGFVGEATDVFFTRLHMRYGAGQADQDLALYLSNDTSSSQVRYITWQEALEGDFPVCGEGWIEGGGTCEDAGLPDGESPLGDAAGGGGCGCRSPGSPGVGAGVLAALLLLRRRRSRLG